MGGVTSVPERCAGATTFSVPFPACPPHRGLKMVRNRTSHNGRDRVSGRASRIALNGERKVLLTMTKTRIVSRGPGATSNNLCLHRLAEHNFICQEWRFYLIMVAQGTLPEGCFPARDLRYCDNTENEDERRANDGQYPVSGAIPIVRVDGVDSEDPRSSLS